MGLYSIFVVGLDARQYFQDHVTMHVIY